MPDYKSVYAGTSILYGPSLNPFRTLNTVWLQNTFTNKNIVAWNSAVSGAWTWNNLVRLPADIVAHAPDVVVFDTANDGNNAVAQAVLEAFIRRLRIDLPNAKIFFLRTAQKESWHNSLATLYGVTLLDWRAWADAEIAAGRHTLDDWYTSPDYTHPNDAGALSIEAFAEQIMLPILNSGSQWTGDIDDYARQYAASADYENAPTILSGTQYTSKTGTWTENGTEIESSEVGATITFTATCRSYGCSSEYTNPGVDVSIDGGEYSTVSISYANGTDVGARASHTITIKVKSGTVKIYQFWAI